jgi:hypothetical protein
LSKKIKKLIKILICLDHSTQASNHHHHMHTTSTTTLTTTTTATTTTTTMSTTPFISTEDPSHTWKPPLLSGTTQPTTHQPFPSPYIYCPPGNLMSFFIFLSSKRKESIE